MTLEKLTIKQKLCVTLDSTSGSNIVPIFNYVPYTKTGYRLIDEYLEIENLKAVSWISSLAAIVFPVFEVEDSESKQLLTAINLEWKSDRIQLDVMCKIDNLAWQKLQAFSLLNADPYPYREYSLGNHPLGNNAMIGLNITDVGYGLLTTQDKVTTYADLVRHITLEKLSVDTSVKVVNNFTPTASVIVSSNLSRKGLIMSNSTDKTVFIDSNASVSTTSYLVELEPSDYWEAPDPIYTGAYYGIVAADSAVIDIREFV